ncbi:MAG: transposase [Xenococcaceae cyanobacterium MO_167.B27]|nr:transposase [Xenococcaceae cyanobacterium MO_167.B27]
MKLVEKHLIKSSKSIYQEIEQLAFLSKNLYNCAIYQCRQAFFQGKAIPSFNQLYHLLKTGDDYKALPSKVSQLVIKQASKSLKSYLASIVAYRKDNSQFLGEPKLPKYKHKTQGRNILTYNYQAISKRGLKLGLIQLSGTKISIPTKQQKVDEVRIIPKGGSYVIEVVYTVEQAKLKEAQEHTRIAGIDIGIDNLACVTSNLPEFKPFIVCGKALKSANRYYNKTKAWLQSLLPKNQYSSHRIQTLTQKRNSKVDYYLHTASGFIVNQLIKQKITLLVIGKNDNWKQKVNLGRKTNQKFTAIPHSQFIEQLIYKCQLAGIQAITVNESYTSKCSFLDLEPINKHSKYLGKRVKRGLFRANSGRVYNCDSNGSLNCILNAVGDSLFQGQLIQRLVVSPVRIKPYQSKSNSHICLLN